MAINKQIIGGRVTDTPKLEETKGGTKVCHLSVAVNRPKKAKEDADRADFFRVTVFGTQAENCAKYLEKGSGAIIFGSIRTGKYQNKEGKNVNTLDIIADRVNFAGKSFTANVNDSVLIGRLTADPEISYTAKSNTCVAKFSVAVDRPKKKGEDQGADFIRVTVYGKNAENCEKYLSKGRQVAVLGELHLESFEGKDGKVNTHEVIASRVEFLSSGGTNAAEKKEALEDLPESFDDSYGWDDVEDDDEPF